MKEEIPQILFLGAREHKDCLRVEFLCGNDGSKGIKIGVHMGGNDLLMSLFQRGDPQVTSSISPRHGKIIPHSG